MGSLYLKGSLFFIFLSQVSSLYVLNKSGLNCSQEGLPCEVEINQCIYKEWLTPQQFTPSSPVDLKVHVEVRESENKELVPVIVAQWKAKDEGSIFFLNGTEFQVTKELTNEHFCVHYLFLQKFKNMRDPNGQQWSFSLDKVVVDPGQTYRVSVANLPKPNIDYTSYDVNQHLSVPGCTDPDMRRTDFCIKSGYTWQPNITINKSNFTMNKPSGRDERKISVAFNTGVHCERYKVFLKCDSTEKKEIYKNNRSVLNVTFNLEAWPRTCCIFDVEIQPFCKICGNDCRRTRQSFNICQDINPDKPKFNTNDQSVWIVFPVLFLLLFSVGLCAIFWSCRRRGGDKTIRHSPPIRNEPLPPAERSVLIIYSRDHPQYTEIVLKLCAFLRAKCGTDVYLDLLDTALVGAMGRLQWTELQKRRIEQSSNKVLILCSRGVQAKWGAMCGGPRVYLREDVSSPMGDMLTVALQLVTPDMQRPASYGKYLVAYFEDICGEHDVPSMFDMAVKYKLMKHFEELYFRILDLEKYQRGKVHKIEGIGMDEYFNCPSGKALREAIETFQAYQLDNPDWFEKQCLDNEDEVPVPESIPFLDQCHQPILRCDPVLNDGSPVCEYEVEVHNVDQTQPVWTSEIHNLFPESEEPSEMGIQSVPSQVYSLYPAVAVPPCLHVAHVCPASLEIHPCILVEPALQEPVPPSSNEVFEMRLPPVDGCSAESDEDALQQLLQFQLSLASFEATAPPPSVEDYRQQSWEINSSQPVEMEESEMLKAPGNRQSRCSDQGYSSRDSIVREEPLAALAKLQEILYMNSPSSSGFGTETMQS